MYGNNELTGVEYGGLPVAVSSSAIAGTTCWGHETGVAETNTRTFAGNWTGTGSIENSGDTERVKIDSGEYMESEVVETGSVNVQLLQNIYRPADTSTLKYRHGVSVVACQGAGWNSYSVPFASDGYVQVRIENGL